MDRRAADPAEVAVDPADQPVDVVAQLAVLLDPLARRCRHLHEDRVVDVELAVLDAARRRRAAGRDALGVVEPVDAEEHLRGSPSASRISVARCSTPSGAGQLLEAGGVDRDRERARPHVAAVGQVDRVAVGLVADPLPDQPHEVGGAAGRWKPTRSAPSSPSRIWRRHGSCLNSSVGGNGMCRKKPIRRSGRSSRSICGHELQLVVVHPHRRVLGGDLGRAPRRSAG